MSAKKESRAKQAPASKKGSSNQDLEDVQGKLEELDPKDKKLVSLILQETRSSYRGPLPTAEQFSIYEKSCPGAGKRILKYMEKEQQTRHGLDTKAISATINETKLGQILGFSVMIALIILAAFVAYFTDNPWLAGAITFLSAGTTVANKLIDGRSNDDKPSRNKKS